MTDTERFNDAVRAYCRDEITADDLYEIAVRTGHDGHDVLAAIDGVTEEGRRALDRRQRTWNLVLGGVFILLLVLSVAAPF